LQENLPITHSLISENRKKFNLSGVKDVLAFEEDTVSLYTSCGKLLIKGEGLHILQFDTKSGDLIGEGKIIAFIYSEGDSGGGGFFSKMFR